jgi:hypothetical protein
LWRLLPKLSSWMALGLAVVAWAMVSGMLWVVRKRS